MRLYFNFNRRNFPQLFVAILIPHMQICSVLILVLLFDSVLFNLKHLSSCILCDRPEGRREPLSAIPHNKFHLETQSILLHHYN